jgi:thiosulfate/3-mercaptopyruvate sulfurtransferase
MPEQININAQPTPYLSDVDPLVEADELIEWMKKEDVILIDTRDSAAYQSSHLPGAFNIQDIFYYLCTSENGGLPGLAAHFTPLFRQAGIRPGQPVVIYEDAMDNGYGKSCRGWMMLNYLGHPNVRVLHGGYRAWMAKKLPTDTSPCTRPASEFVPTITPGVMITAADMRAVIDRPEVVILDVRDFAEWIGANSSPYGFDYCPRKGRIPRATWLEWYRMMKREKGIPWFRGTDDVRAIAEGVGLKPGSTIYVYCFKGARASNVALALVRAGYKHVHNYLSSWNEWSRDMSLPVDEEYPEEDDS